MDLLTQSSDGVARITFNRPDRRNAVTGAILADMRQFLADVESSAMVRCIVVTGMGEHFMGGGDVAGFDAKLGLNSAERHTEFLARVRNGAQLMIQLARMPQPIVCRVKGAAAGAALGIIGAADFVICGESSRFVLAQVGIGASPDSGTSWLLPRIVGARRAMEIALLGEKFGATAAMQMGLVNRVVPDLELDSAVDEVVARILAAPAESVREVKRLLNAAQGNSLKEQLEMEAQSFAACAATDDFVEGVRAFMEKRPARFNRSSQ